MRICIVTREYPPVTAYSGGIGTLFATLAPELARQGHEPHVLTLSEGAPGTAEHEGVRAHQLARPIPRRLWSLEDVPWSFVVERHLRRHERFDAVFAAEWGGDAWRYSAHEQSGPLITHLTTALAQILAIAPELRWSREWRIRNASLIRLERRQSERSSAIVASSRAILDWSRELWNLDGIPSTVLPNMVDVDRVRELARGQLPEGFPRERPVVAFSGRLEVRKGVDVLTSAMAEIWREFPSAQLVMLGRDTAATEGMMGDRLRTIAADHADRLHFLGPQPPERLFPALAASDVVAFPSRWENFSLGALEALALGKPIVVTSGSGFDDFFVHERNGLMVPPRDAPALARALVRVLADAGLRERLGTSAASSSELYRPQPVTERFVSFFAEVAGTAA